MSDEQLGVHSTSGGWVGPVARDSKGRRYRHGGKLHRRSSVNLMQTDRQLIDEARGDEPLSQFIRRAAVDAALDARIRKAAMEQAQRELGGGAAPT